MKHSIQVFSDFIKRISGKKTEDNVQKEEPKEIYGTTVSDDLFIKTKSEVEDTSITSQEDQSPYFIDLNQYKEGPTSKTETDSTEPESEETMSEIEYYLSIIEEVEDHYDWSAPVMSHDAIFRLLKNYPYAANRIKVVLTDVHFHYLFVAEESESVLNQEERNILIPAFENCVVIETTSIDGFKKLESILTETYEKPNDFTVFIV